MQPDMLEFWIDLNLPHQMAAWIKEDFGVAAKSFKELIFFEVPDIEVYKIAAAKSNIIVITTKDVDFVNHQNIVGAPPKILYLNIGNISNKDLKALIRQKFAAALEKFLNTDDSFVEISTYNP